MDIIKRLNDLRFERNLSVYRLSELSGLNQSTLANTFSRGTVPSIANLEAMCNAMGITLAQFFNNGEESQTLTTDEIKLISEYRKLTPTAKKAINDLLKEIK
ncbi:MAG: helix-turn-helix domain-containing protein [Clostridiales bacterium]|nr:helix-turn-helix domain-containing protein [Clostridiales bacterium]